MLCILCIWCSVVCFCFAVKKYRWLIYFISTVRKWLKRREKILKNAFEHREIVMLQRFSVKKRTDPNMGVQTASKLFVERFSSLLFDFLYAQLHTRCWHKKRKDNNNGYSYRLPSHWHSVFFFIRFESLVLSVPTFHSDRAIQCDSRSPELPISLVFTCSIRRFFNFIVD